MRGQHLFSSLFEMPASDRVRSTSKGRSSTLDARRTELLMHRYYYYGTHTMLRYPLIMERLSDEFFLTKRRIQDIIQSHSSLMRTIRDRHPRVGELRSKWPHLVWK